VPDVEVAGPGAPVFYREESTTGADPRSSQKRLSPSLCGA
jgi:hypothetical protein